MDASDDIMQSAKPPKPPRPTDPHDAERRRSVLLHTVAVAAVAAAVFTGVTAWEVHQDRTFTKNLYCSSFAASSESESDPQESELADKLGC
ncbi:MAG TPA: hypothetical protein VGV65_10415 [Nocardioides sp.]|nr:hypothetical protein [Nocardioides sp.]